MFRPDQWCSVETLSKKTSQLLYHLELFKWVQQPSSYDNSSWGGGVGWGGGDISLRIHGPIVFLNREKEPWPNSGQIRPPPPYISLCRTKHTISKICSPQPAQSCDSPSVHLSPPLRRPEKEH